jgi:23S rRNA (adenine2503-C2)-methyltransferase
MFCATGKLGFKRDLNFSEIVSQIKLIELEENIKISNIVFMGMGEPLLNIDNVKKAINFFNNSIYGFNISARKITISTAGIPNEITHLGSLNMQIVLAISLNSPIQSQRELIMPIAKKYNLDELFQAIKKYQKYSNRRVTFEYILIKDTNDSLDHANKLIKITKDIKCNINLIPFNKVYGCGFQRPNTDIIEKFKLYLEKNNLTVTIRNSYGQTNDAACGQLALKYKKKEE